MAEEINVLLLIIAQSPGGVEKRFYNYSKYLSGEKQGRNTIVISRSLISSLGIFSSKYNNKVICYGIPWNKKNAITRYLDYMLLLPVLLRLSFKKFDVVHFVTLSSLLFRHLIQAKHKVFSIVTSIKKSQEEIFNSKMCRHIMAENYKMDCLDENIRRTALAHYPDQSSNIFSSPCSFVDYEDTISQYEEKENCICFAGRLEDFKGIQLLVSILTDITKETNFSIKIFGQGQFHNKIFSIIEENGLQGRVSLSYTLNLKEELVKSKIFLSLQRGENYPSQSLIEAMACGNAIIATDVGLTANLVKENFGILIPFDSKALLKAIVKMTASGDSLKEMGILARNFVLSHHTIERFHQYLISVYKKQTFIF